MRPAQHTKFDDIMLREQQGIQIRHMHHSDLDEVLRIERGSFAHPWSRIHFLSSLMRKPVAQCWVAVFEERIEGFVIAWYIPRYSDEAGEAHIHNIAVHPEARREGLGRLLLKTAIQHGKALGCDEVSLEVRASNQTARAFYDRCGFKVQGRRDNYYGDEDALVMNASAETIFATI